MKPIKENIVIIDIKRGYFECKNYCSECNASKGKCSLLNKIMEEDK